MKTILMFLSWIWTLFFSIFFVLSVASGYLLPSLLIISILLLIIPPVQTWIREKAKINFPFWIKLILIPVLFILFNYLIFFNMGNSDSIFKNQEIEQRLMQIYEKKMQKWPVPNETRLIKTEYGKVHVIISGPADSSALMLLHASGMGGWSWLYNVKGLNDHYRTFAIDMIGDAGKSKLNQLDHYPKTGPELADFISCLMDSLGVEKASFIGGSQGGYISTNVAIYAPNRIEKLICSGPMGYTGTNLSVLRIVLTTMFPVKPLQSSSFAWAFGNDPTVTDEVHDWFYSVLEGVIPKQAQPVPFTEEQFKRINVPVLLLLGLRDGLVGDPERTKEVVKSISDIQVEILNAGHLISAELPEKFNKLVLDFLKSE